jgi:dihydroorotase
MAEGSGMEFNAMCSGKITNHTRRNFLRQTIIGSSLVCTLLPDQLSLLGRASPAPARFDLLVKGGKVIDPSQQLSAPRDIGIRDGKIAEVSGEIGEGDARQVLDARGKLVTPGLIDVHVHVYDGVAPLGIASPRA